MTTTDSWIQTVIDNAERNLGADSTVDTVWLTPEGVVRANARAHQDFADSAPFKVEPLDPSDTPYFGDRPFNELDHAHWIWEDCCYTSVRWCVRPDDVLHREPIRCCVCAGTFTPAQWIQSSRKDQLPMHKGCR
jgi:hypothetical protein